MFVERILFVFECGIEVNLSEGKLFAEGFISLGVSINECDVFSELFLLFSRIVNFRRKSILVLELLLVWLRKLIAIGSLNC